MNKAILAAFCLASGACLGLVVGYQLGRNSKKDDEYVEPIHKEDVPETKEESVAEKSQSDIFKIKPAKLATPEETGINYRQYVKDLKYAEETEHPTDDIPDEDDREESGLVDEEDELDPLDYEETYEERVKRENEEIIQHAEEYRKEHKGKIELMTEDDWNTDFPESDYEREDLYYFTEDDILSDEDGTVLDKGEYLGNKVERIGWYRSPEDEIYVRNHPKEKEYRVMKERMTYNDWWS